MTIQSDGPKRSASAVNEMNMAIEEVARSAVGSSKSSKQAFQESEIVRKQDLEAGSSICETYKHINRSSDTVNSLASLFQHVRIVIEVARFIAAQTIYLHCTRPSRQQLPVNNVVVSSYCR